MHAWSARMRNSRLPYTHPCLASDNAPSSLSLSLTHTHMGRVRTSNGRSCGGGSGAAARGGMPASDTR
jgi:hypothetical protein